MLFYRYSENRIFFLNEYWILIPSALLANYFILRKIRDDKKQIENLRLLKAQLERQTKLKKLAILALGVSGSVHLLNRGGSTDLIDTDYIRDICQIDSGIRYLDDRRLKNIVIDLYRHKRKGQIIYITATALCHLAGRYGRKFLALPVAVGDFGITNLYQTGRKTLVVLLWGGVVPIISFNGPFAFAIACALAATGLKLALINLDFIATSPFDPTKDLKPGVREVVEVVVMNNRDNNKIIMQEKVQKNRECWLPDQRFLNKNCNEVTDISDSVLPNVSYEKTVNMRDVTGLNRQDFTDVCDMPKAKQDVCDIPKAKQVNFSDKFNGLGEDKGKGWDICENEFTVPNKRNLRTRNKP